MPSKRIAFHDFDQRLWLSAGRDAIPQNGLRRGVGIAPEATRSLLSRWGSSYLYSINAKSVFEFAGVRYAYDGAHLYANGSIVTQNGNPITWDGTRLTFAVMPPQAGLPDYLFVIGGGNAIKIAPALVGGVSVPTAQQVTQWGINAPPDGLAAQLGTQQLTTIDAFDSTVGNWTGNSNVTVSQSTNDPYDGAADMKIVLNGTGPQHTTRTYVANLAIYSGPVISLQTDIISFWFKCANPTAIGYVELTFNIGVTTNLLSAPWTLKDFYRLTTQIVQNTNQPRAAGAQLFVTPQPGQWIQIAAPKSLFMRTGTNLNLDWSDVNGIRFRFGQLGTGVQTSCNLDQLQMQGGYALGAGPAATSGGSEYQGYVTFGNNLTGSDSNPNGMNTLADGSVSAPNPAIVAGVALQQINWSNIPISSDPQVGNRKLWRTTADGDIPFFLDIIPDNTTTTYIDSKGDLPGQPIIVTPWVKSVAVIIGDYVDGGNGYYFICTTGGTTGATVPNWAIPTGSFLGFWSPITKYLVGNWVSFNGTGYVCIANALGTTESPSNASFWTALSTTNDNGVIWTWAGLNEVPHLGDQQMLLDNAPPSVTYGDAVGPYQDSMFWCRDSTPGRRGWTYSSPPGRPESVANQFAPTSDDDPTQKQIIFDYTLWLITTKGAFQTDGQNPDSFVYFKIMYATGTSNPFSAVAGQEGVYYQASDGIRVINRAGSFLPGFDNIADIERGQSVENVTPFTAVIAEFARNEVIFSDGAQSFGLQRGPNGYIWRMLGVGLTAIYYERDDNEILAAFNQFTVLYEDPDSYADATSTSPTAIPFEIQTASQLLDEGQVAVVRRIFVDLNTKIDTFLSAQTLTPVVCTDLGEETLATISSAGRSTVEIAFQQPARQFSLRLTGSLRNRIEIFGIELDVALTGSEVTQASA